jgi:hypothetical protein
MSLRPSPWTFGLLFAAFAATAACGPDSGDAFNDALQNTCAGGDVPCPSSAPVCVGDDDTVPSCQPALDFRACTAASDCPASEAICYGLAEGYAQGRCSRAQSFWSEDRDECGTGAAQGNEAGGAASSSITNGQSVVSGGDVCAPSCLGGTGCGVGFACNVNTIDGQTGMPDTAGCWVHCQDDFVCVAGQTCNPYTHFCGTPFDPTLQDDGQPCAVGTDCRSGWCLKQTLVGFLDGMCVSPCVEPGAAAYGTSSLPASDCPGNEACVAGPSAGPGYLTECRPRCTTSSDCRTDYVCQHVGAAADGFCGTRTDPLVPEE